MLFKQLQERFVSSAHFDQALTKARREDNGAEDNGGEGSYENACGNLIHQTINRHP